MLAMLVVTSGPGYAQQPGGVAGVVTDTTGGALAGVVVLATRVSTGVIAPAVTDRNGRFAIDGLAADSYTVTAELPGFSSTARENVVVGAGAAVEIALEMGLAIRAETVVVTGSRKQELVRHTPAAVSVVDGGDLSRTPTENVGDLLRGTPEMNVIQTSARDINLSARSATDLTARTTLAMLDGRPISQGYFGLMLWDLLPVGFDEIKRIEVVRGPGSAVWGANALTGVVHVIIKSPQELAGTSVRLGVGELGTRSLSLLHAAVDGRVGYKVSGSFFTQDAWERPTSFPDGSLVAPYENLGTTQGRMNVRLDLQQGPQTGWRFDSGYATSDGVLVTNAGPFETNRLHEGYAKAEYRNGGFLLNTSLTVHDAFNGGLLSADETIIATKTLLADARQRLAVGRHIISVGGSARYNHFDINLVPNVHSRNEAGAFIEDEILLRDRVRARLGGRVDYFSTFGATFSPRVGLVVEPVIGHTVRASYSRAYIAPSYFENFFFFPFSLTVSLPTGPYAVPLLSRGNEDLDEETIDAFEVGYTGIINDRMTVGASVYHQRIQGLIELLPLEFYTPSTPPPGWPLPPAALAAIPLPSLLSFVNVGEVTQRGVELSAHLRVDSAVSVQGTYSYQDEPDVVSEFPIPTGVPPAHVGNLSVSYEQGRVLGTLAVNFTDEAFWSVPPFMGPPDTLPAR